MRSPINVALLAIIALGVLTACQKSTVMFHPGDRVRIRASDMRGVVYLRLSPAADDLYYLAMPGALPEHEIPTDGVSDRAKSSFWWKPSEPWHTQGPYHATDLELTP
jgi:hypothetical protein